MGINLGRLQEFAKRGTGGINYFKVNKKGSVRIRIVGDPFGNPEDPVILADRHWYPIIDATGKEQRKFSQCGRTLGDEEFCPFCHLVKLMYNSEDPAMQEEARSLKAGKSYGMWVIDRTYLEAKGAEYDPDKEVLMLATFGPSIFNNIIELAQGSHWGEGCFYPVDGYDLIITGSPKPGTSFSEYKISPVPMNASPDVDMSLLDEDKCKPLVKLFPVKSLDAQIKLLQPILSSLTEYGNIGTSIVETFLEDINGLVDLDAVFAGENGSTPSTQNNAPKSSSKAFAPAQETKETEMPDVKNFREDMEDEQNNAVKDHIVSDGDEIKQSATRSNLLARLGKQ